VFSFTPDIVASFSIPQLRAYKGYAYTWDYLQCSQFNGLTPKKYDEIFATKVVSDKNRKNDYKRADKMLPAIAELNKEGIKNPTVRQINDKIEQMGS